MEYYLDGLKKYVTFSGKATRTQYWMFALFNTLALVVIAWEKYALGVTLTDKHKNPITSDTERPVRILQQGDVIVPLAKQPVYIKEIKVDSTFVTTELVLRQHTSKNEELPPWALVLIAQQYKENWRKGYTLIPSVILKHQLEPIRAPAIAEAFLDNIHNILKLREEQQHLTERLYKGVAHRFLNNLPLSEKPDILKRVMTHL